MQNNLYTYVPKDNTVATDGLLSITKVPWAVEKYRSRVADTMGVSPDKVTRQDILDWLESTGKGRSHSISVLTEPIPETGINKHLLAFAKRKSLVKLPAYDKLRGLGLVGSLYLAHQGRRGIDQVSEVDYSPTVWQSKPGRGGMLFDRTKHYILSLNEDRIPPELLDLPT